MARLAAVPVIGLAATVALVAGAGSACSRTNRACTEVGCTSSVTVDASAALAAHPGAAVIEVCVRARCRSYGAAEAAAPLVQDDERLGDLAPSEVVVSLLDGRGVLVVRGDLTASLTAVQPNGEGCPPVCGQARLALGPDGMLVPAPVG